MTNANNVGRPDVTGVSRNQKQLIIPIDDERNNARFRHRHPNIIFQGYRKKSVPKYHDLPPLLRNRPHTRINHPVISGRSSPHSAVGQTPQALGDPVDDAFSNDYNPSNAENNFLFHEVADENYTLEDDANNNSDADRDVIRAYEGASQGSSENNLSIPVNLSISNITTNAQIESTDGIPTYVTTLTFDVDVPADDYEVRIVKI